MNVTTSAYWQRPPVGIVRVERSLCVELAKLYGAHFRLCVWQGNKFIEWVHKIETQATAVCSHHKGTHHSLTDKPVLPPIFPILPKRQAFVALGQGLLSLMPSKLQPYFNRLLYALRPCIVRLPTNDRLKRLMVSLRGQESASSGMSMVLSPNVTDVGALFSPGDILISVGLDWDLPYYKEFYTLRKYKGLRVVTCCYDLIPVLYPQYCVNDVAVFFTSYFLEVADGSDLVLCISRQSEKDLNEMLEQTGGAKPPTHVFPLGDNALVAGNEEISSTVNALCKESFILFVSTIERRKNHEVLYRAYHLLCAQGKRVGLPKLVFVGMQGWGVNELLKDIELDPLTRDLIIFLNHISDAELRVLYQAAKFCVFPSLYEGWGLPVGEALSLGKAVICSNRGSLPEVGEGVVLFVDPWSPHAWAEEIYRMAIDDGWREQWEQKAKELYRTKTWVDAALSVTKAIQDKFEHNWQSV
jgi:glycosyltransferase involved in cell wall biosynthesis